ncbi:hypothetical protein EJ05DRAFT_536665 [Pseudovirgaria hyperparasitica]|uniref:BTB domain-containing protein n=1 Tax=Pseudovirgaria hyperparasitica TaxID=470096 RepID=A0A6A6WEX7_9PEZI|nr:uncharacterized protein EJ05DRAFT_536665 [Pseudovirgaria hyperparasitica]KAF2760584.1 hypothetical protein EJ05DRAFT_536665 [Pseudovirgaria hyperparasitica]
MSLTTETKSEKPKSDAKELLEVIELDEDWNLTVVIGAVQQRFRVCRQALMVSPVWRRMFGPPFGEPDMSEISMPEDDANAMGIVLNMAHHKYEAVPKRLDTTTFYNVALLVSKYSLETLVLPFWKPWYDELIGMHDPFSPTPHPYLVFIAWAFGDVELFTATTLSLIIHASPENPDNPTDCSLEAMALCRMPPGVLDRIIDTRTSKLADMLQLIQDHMELALQDHCLLDDRACDSCMLGSFIKSLDEAGLWPIPDNPSDCRLSLNEMNRRLEKIMIEPMPSIETTKYQQGSVHAACAATCQFDREGLRDVYRSIAAPIDKALRRHMDVQRTKLNGLTKRKREDWGV